MTRMNRHRNNSKLLKRSEGAAHTEQLTTMDGGHSRTPHHGGRKRSGAELFNNSVAAPELEGHVCTHGVVNKQPCLNRRVCPATGKLSLRECASLCAKHKDCELFVWNAAGKCYPKADPRIDAVDDARHGTITCVRELVMRRQARRQCECPPTHRPLLNNPATTLVGAYLGFAGDNLGDRAMFETSQCLFYCASRGRALLGMSAVISPSAAFVVLGGGSLLNAGGHFELLIERFVEWCEPRPHRCFVAGTGWDDTTLRILPNRLTAHIPQPSELTGWHQAAQSALNVALPGELRTKTTGRWARLHSLLSDGADDGGRGGGRGVRGGVRGSLTAAALRAAADAQSGVRRVRTSAGPPVAGDVALATPALLRLSSRPASQVPLDCAAMPALSAHPRRCGLCVMAANSSDGGYLGTLSTEHEALVRIALRWWQDHGERVYFVSMFASELRDVDAVQRLRDRAFAQAVASNAPHSESRLRRFLRSAASSSRAPRAQKPKGGIEPADAFNVISATSTQHLLSTLHHKCAFTIAHKLHAYILSAASGVPTVALAYRAKTFDVAFSRVAAAANGTAGTDSALPSALLVPMAGLQERVLQAAVDATYGTSAQSSATGASARSKAAAAWWLKQAEEMLAHLGL